MKQINPDLSMMSSISIWKRKSQVPVSKKHPFAINLAKRYGPF